MVTCHLTSWWIVYGLLFIICIYYTLFSASVVFFVLAINLHLLIYYGSDKYIRIEFIYIGCILSNLMFFAYLSNDFSFQCYRKLSCPISDFASRTAKAYASSRNGFLQLSFCVSLVDGLTISVLLTFVNQYY